MTAKKKASVTKRGTSKGSGASLDFAALVLAIQRVHEEIVESLSPLFPGASWIVRSATALSGKRLYTKRKPLNLAAFEE